MFGAVDGNVLGCRRERLSGGSFVHDYVVSPLVRLTLIRTAANVGGFGYAFAFAVYTISQFSFMEPNCEMLRERAGLTGLESAPMDI